MLNKDRQLVGSWLRAEELIYKIWFKKTTL